MNGSKNFNDTIEESKVEILPQIETKKFEEWNMVDISFWVKSKLRLHHLDLIPWNQNQIFGEDLLHYDERMLFKILKVKSMNDRRTIILAVKGMSDF